VTSRGRPPIGPTVVVRMPPELVQQLDERAEREGVARAELVRRIIANALTVGQ
jgi:metal-responsive CopG/Arc/MetJ family transcriptional regulator